MTNIKEALAAIALAVISMFGCWLLGAPPWAGYAVGMVILTLTKLELAVSK